MKMHLPNILIIFRVLLIPVFLFFFLSAPPMQALGGSVPAFRIIAFIFFLTAALTDLLDGHLARKWNLVSNFGALMDPLADKMLVCSALVALAFRQELAAWIVILIICREFWVTSLRMLALEQGRKVISASVWGKIKTVLQIIMVSALIAGRDIVALTGLVRFADVLTMILIYLTILATVLSAVEYTRSYKDVFIA